MSYYDIVLSDGVTTFPVYALEQDGPGNLSVPRQVLRVVLSGGANVNYFEIGGDLTYRFIPGFVFDVIIIDPLVTPVTANTGTYTVVSSSFSGTTTTIVVAEVIPRGFFTVVGVLPGASQWTISGNHAIEFGVDTKVIITGNTGGANGVYTIVSATNAGPNTNIVVAESVPLTATADGLLVVNTHSITAFTPGLGGTWQITGEVQDRFPVNSSFNVTGTGVGDGSYVVTTAVNGVGVTTITVAGTIPVGTTLSATSAILIGNLPLGHIQYTVPASDGGVNTPFVIPGRGMTNWGQSLEQNQVRHLENFNSTTPPPAPIQGQQWYDTGVGLFLYASTPPVDIVAVNNGINTWIAQGDLTSVLSPGDKFIVFGDTGMPFASIVYQVQTITYNIGPNTTDIVIDTTPSVTPPFTVVANSISPLAVGNGQLYLAVDFHQVAVSNFAMTDTIDMGNFNIVNVADPVNPQDAATMNYVDTRTLNDLADVTITAPVNTEVLTYNGSVWVNAPGGGGSSALSGITAATANATINNGNFNITWNWQLATDEVAFLFSETAPSTGGTGNQVLLEAATLTNSTASAFRAARGSSIMIETESNGDLTLAGGNNASVDGGSINIAAGNSTTANGGAVTIAGGISGDGNGGGISIDAGDGVGTDRLGGNLSLTAGDATGAQNGGDVTVTAGSTTGAFQNGGNVLINAGTPTNGAGGNGVFNGGNGTNGNGGAVTIQGGNAAGGASYTGGTVLIQGGAGSPTGTGGSVELIAGDSGIVSGYAGLIDIQAGTGNGTTIGGSVSINAGASDASDGGDFTLRAGFSTDTGTAGNGGAFVLSSGTVAGGVTATGNGGPLTIQSGSASGSGSGGSISIRAGSSFTGTPGNILQITNGGFWRQTAGPFTLDDNYSGQYILRAQTIAGTITEMFLNGSGGTQRMVVPDDTTWLFDIKIVARRTDVNDEGFAVKYEGAIDRNVGVGTIALIGPPLQTTIADDSGGIWTVTVDADTTNGALRIRVTGEVGKTIRWVAFVRTVEVSG